MTVAKLHVAMRTCAGCRQRDRQTELVRLIVGDEGRIVRLAGAHRTGRSAYVHDRAACLTRLAGSRSLGRSLRTNPSKTVRARLLADLCAEETGV